MSDAIAWFIKSFHWLTITGLIITILGTLYTAYSFLDKHHWLLRALSRFLLQTMISTIIGGLIFGAFGITTHAMRNELLIGSEQG